MPRVAVALLLGCGSDSVSSAEGEPARAVPDPMSGAAWPMPTEGRFGLPNERSYELLSSDVALDNVTGLYWQRSIVARPFQPWQGALAACDDLQLGGFSDWRLPSRIELTSILALDAINPAIDFLAFPATPGDWFWTSTPDAVDESKAWYVYFYLGSPNRDEKTNPFSVRCVRSDPERSAPAQRYVSTDQSVRDQMTGLEWQRTIDPELFSFGEASAHCGGLELAGKAAWRAPTMQELETLVDARYRAPAIDSSVFPDTPAASFWSLTPWVESPELRGWHVDFNDGSAQYLAATTRFNVRCVRGVD